MQLMTVGCRSGFLSLFPGDCPFFFEEEQEAAVAFGRTC